MLAAKAKTADVDIHLDCISRWWFKIATGSLTALCSESVDHGEPNTSNSLKNVPPLTTQSRYRKRPISPWADVIEQAC